MFWQRVLQNRQKKVQNWEENGESLAHKLIVNTEFDFWKNPSITNCATRAPLMMVYVLRLRADSLFMNGRKEGCVKKLICRSENYNIIISLLICYSLYTTLCCNDKQAICIMLYVLLNITSFVINWSTKRDFFGWKFRPDWASSGTVFRQ